MAIFAAGEEQSLGHAADQAKGIYFAYLVQRSTTLGICRINYLSPRSRSPVKLDKSTGGATMQQIADWLKTLGMSEYQIKI